MWMQTDGWAVFNTRTGCISGMANLAWYAADRYGARWLRNAARIIAPGARSGKKEMP